MCVSEGDNFEQIDTGICTHQPFFASAEAAGSWLHAHPGGHVFTITEMFERPWHAYLEVFPALAERRPPNFAFVSSANPVEIDRHR